MIRDVTAEITERLVAEEEQQPVSEVESRGCCYSYRRVNLCRTSRDDELRTKVTLSNLKSVCLKYGIQGVWRNKRKEPYVNALLLGLSKGNARVEISASFFFFVQPQFAIL